MILTLFVAGFVAVIGLPSGYEKATWGMSAEELQQVASVDKIELGDGLNYAEHLEEDPEVYVRLTDQHERIEYYFFEGRLYKIFIVYDRILYHTHFYDRLIGEVKGRYGPPHKIYQEELFGLPIQHSLWEDKSSILDLRKGAGFVYQVRIDKATDQKKARSLHKKKGI